MIRYRIERYDGAGEFQGMRRVRVRDHMDARDTLLARVKSLKPADVIYGHLGFQRDTGDIATGYTARSVYVCRRVSP